MPRIGSHIKGDPAEYPWATRPRGAMETPWRTSSRANGGCRAGKSCGAALRRWAEPARCSPARRPPQQNAQAAGRADRDADRPHVPRPRPPRHHARRPGAAAPADRSAPGRDPIAGRGAVLHDRPRRARHQPDPARGSAESLRLRRRRGRRRDGEARPGGRPRRRGGHRRSAASAISACRGARTTVSSRSSRTRPASRRFRRSRKCATARASTRRRASAG